MNNFNHIGYMFGHTVFKYQNEYYCHGYWVNFINECSKYCKLLTLFVPLEIVKIIQKLKN